MFLYAALTFCLAPIAALPSPPGTHVNLTEDDLAEARNFRAGEPVVGTYFFYWYNIHTKEHFLNGDGSDALVDHPATVADFSYASADWWMREMRDVAAAGIDFIAPVYWGVPGYDSWSFQGLPKLVEAWEKLVANGESPPRVGLFYDTSTLRHNPPHKHVDLSTDDGKQWFYHTIRDYFSLIPPRMWAMVGGRPIVLLYSAAFAAKQDPAAIEYVYRSFEKDFACRPYIIKEVSWQGNADSDYAWGGALKPRWHGVAALGPGYDHHAVPGRRPLVVDREGGAFYERAWEALLAQNPERRASIVMVETWNELHEGTDICETREYGRQYIELTARYAEQFRAGVQLPPGGKYGQSRKVFWDSVEGENGAVLGNSGDGLTEEVQVAGVSAIRTRQSQHHGQYLYVALDDSFLHDRDIPVRIELTYLDSDCDAIRLEYDSSDPEGSVHQGAFKFGGEESVGDSGHWKLVSFEVKDGRFVSRCNGADFRFAVTGGALTVRRVIVEKLAP